MKKNEILPFSCKWMELENIIVSEVSQVRRPKIICSPSYVDFRSRVNAAMLLDLVHMLRESTYWRYGDRKETQNLKVFDVLSAEELIQKP
jgi:hypothetical protein